MRKIHLNNEIWTYRVGKQHTVIFSPSGQKFLVDHSQMTGMNWDDIERAQWKGYWTGITPSHVKEYIQAGGENGFENGLERSKCG